VLRDGDGCLAAILSLELTLMIVTSVFSSPVGELLLGSFDGQLCLCDWRYRKQRELIDRRIQDGLGEEFREGTSLVIDQAKEELSEYFSGNRVSFAVPCLLAGTDFQKLVWDQLLTIPFGTTLSYQDLANRLGKPTAVRGVAAANGANALSIFVPCHRILGSSGDLVGYAGGLRAKQKLLELENPVKNTQFLMFD